MYPHYAAVRVSKGDALVDGQPFLMLGAELHNSSASSLEYLRSIWPRLAAMHINTVLTPVYWELLEPEEGRFDFQPGGRADSGSLAPPPAPLVPLVRKLEKRHVDEYLVAGSGAVSVTFSPNSPGPPIAGIASIEEGTFVDGRWIPGRRLNGDENGQGKFLRIGGMGNTSRIQRVKLYRYR